MALTGGTHLRLSYPASFTMLAGEVSGVPGSFELESSFDLCRNEYSLGYYCKKESEVTSDPGLSARQMTRLRGSVR